MLFSKLGGSGGGGDDDSQGAKQAPNTLLATQKLRIVDLISEGPIKGLVNNLQSVFVSGTPIQNPDGSMNIDGFLVQGRNGTVNQTYIPGFGEQESEKPVGVQVKKDTPITRRLESSDADVCRVSVSIPSLQLIDTKTGSTSPTNVELEISVQSNGGGFVPQIIGAKKVGQGRQYFTETSTDFISMITGWARTAIAVKWKGTLSPNTQTVSFLVQRRVKTGGPWVTLTSKVFQDKATLITPAGTYNNAVYEEPKATLFFYDPTGGVAYDYRISYGTVTNTVLPTFDIERCEVWQEAATDNIVGVTDSKYEKEYRINLVGDGPYDIRVRRITDDSTSTYLNNDLYFESFTEIIEEKLSYPYSAYIALTIDAEQYNGIPERSYHTQGMLVKIPVNYDPVLRTYDGIWDGGTFKVDYTDNPAWCLRDLITNKRYGIGDYVDEDDINNAAFYKIAKLCDEPVPDGYGGTEPRYTCSLYIQGREGAYKVLSDMASIFNGLLYWSSGNICVTADAEEDPVWLFTNANVINGEFVYQGSSKNTRHTVAHVTYRDKKDRFQEKVEYVSLGREEIIKHGVKPISFVATGATSRGQAHRLGKTVLLSEQYLTETVSFTTGIEGVGSGLAPGSIIKISDANRSGQRWGGRIISATANQIVLDAPISVTEGTTYTLSFISSTGTLEESTLTFTTPDTLFAMGDGTKNLNIDVPIIDADGEAIGAISSQTEYTILTFDTPLGNVPQGMAVWILQSDAVSAELFRVLSIKEKDKVQYEITALAYNQSKFDAVDFDADFTVPNTTVPDRWVVPQPTSLVLKETNYVGPNNEMLIKLSVSVDRPTFSLFSHHEIYWRYFDEQWQRAEDFILPFTSIQPVLAKSVEVSVEAVNIYGIHSYKTYGVLDLNGDFLLTPPNVDNFAVSIQRGNGYFTWTIPDVMEKNGISHYVIKHSPIESTGVGWGQAVAVGSSIAYPGLTAVLPAMRGTYLIKAVSRRGRESDSPAILINTLDNSNDFTLIQEHEEHPYFTGAKVHTAAGGGNLFLAGSAMIDWVPLKIAKPLKDKIFGSGEYYLQPVSLSETYSVRITALMEVGGISNSNFIAGWTSLANIDSIGGEDTSQWNAVVYYRWRNKTEDPWSAWIPFSTTEATFQYAEFKLILETKNPDISPVVSSLAVRIEAKNRVEGEEDIVSAANVGGTTIYYDRGFYRSPSVAIVAQDMETGDYYSVVDKDNNGFTIVFYNSVGIPVSRMFDYVAKGFGYSYGVGGTKYKPNKPNTGLE